MKHKHLKGLNTLRFFAAFLVVIYHGKHHINKMGVDFAENWAIFNRGIEAVSFFFVLSGFLITFLAINEIKYKGRVNYKNFFLRRVFRIMPLYYLILFLMLFFLGFVAPKLLSQENVLVFPMLKGTLLYVFMIPNLVKPLWPDIPGGMNIFWSIGVEEQFYLIFPVLIFFYLKSKNKVYTLLTVFLLYYIFYMLVYYNVFNLNQVLVKFILTLKFHYMLMGMALAEFAQKAILKEKLVKLINKDIYQFISFGLVICVLFLDIEYPKILEDILLCLIFSNLIFVVAFRTTGSLLNYNIKFLSYFGVISYGIYLIHPLVSYFVRMLIVKIQFLNKLFLSYPIIYIVILFMVTLLCSHVSYKFFEKPFLKFKEKFR